MKVQTCFNPRQPFWLLLEACLLLSLWGCAQVPSSKSLSNNVSKSTETPTPQGPAAEWRAINRLTYGPTPASVAEIKSQGNPQAWALKQLEDAKAASLQAAQLPADLASINASLPTIFDGARQEREARAL